jgi:hypothetical protein
LIASFAKRWNRWRYAQACRAVLDTPPIPADTGDLTVLSQLAGRYVLMYLLAAKSLYARLQEGRFVIVDDGSMTDAHHDVLRRHLRNVRIVHIDQIERGPVPKGGTWERLLHISDLVRDSYVLQLDSDTLTVSDIDEVALCVRENRSFTLVSEQDASIVPVRDAAALARRASQVHIQILAEQNLDRILDAEARKYVRGCSGFAGFARSSFSREQIYQFSTAMQELVGHRWSEWGTEQITSNFIVANSANAIILPTSKYRNYEGIGTDLGASFLHFIGTYRFADATYRKRSTKLIRDLDKGSAAFR